MHFLVLSLMVLHYHKNMDSNGYLENKRDTVIILACKIHIIRSLLKLKLKKKI